MRIASGQQNARSNQRFNIDSLDSGIVRCIAIARWANRAALSLWNASSLEELINRDWSDCSEATKIRLQKYLEQIKQGQTVFGQWTFSPQGHAVSVRCICSSIRIEDGHLAMLVESITELSDWIDKVFSTETQVQTSNGIR